MIIAGGEACNDKTIEFRVFLFLENHLTLIMNKNIFFQLLIYIIILIFFFQCNNPQTSQTNENIADSIPTIVNKENCKPYFEFDEVIHYKIKIAEKDIVKLIVKENRNKNEENLYRIVSSTFSPKSLNDTSVISNLVEIGFKKIIVNKNKFPLLEQIFCERKHKEYFSLSCIANYRDVLIFKKKKKTVGIAKICFECSQHIIIGAKGNTEYFGQSGDIGKLESLLKVK